MCARGVVRRRRSDERHRTQPGRPIRSGPSHRRGPPPEVSLGPISATISSSSSPGSSTLIPIATSSSSSAAVLSSGLLSSGLLATGASEVPATAPSAGVSAGVSLGARVGVAASSPPTEACGPASDGEPESGSTASAASSVVRALPARAAGPPTMLTPPSTSPTTAAATTAIRPPLARLLAPRSGGRVSTCVGAGSDESAPGTIASRPVGAGPEPRRCRCWLHRGACPSMGQASG